MSDEVSVELLIALLVFGGLPRKLMRRGWHGSRDELWKTSTPGHVTLLHRLAIVIRGHHGLRSLVQQDRSFSLLH